MSEEFKISRLRYNWAGVWSSARFYNRDAVISHEGKTYVCIEPHTSSSFNTDLTFVTGGGEQRPRWELMIDGKVWKQEWIPTSEYYPGNIVKYKGVVYFASTYHISTDTFDITKWATYASLDNWNVTWNPNFVYGVGDIVKYGGIVYRCIQNHASAETVNLGLENDLSKWQIINAGIEYKGAWSQNNVKYKLNDVVKNGPDLWRAVVGHVSSSTFDINVWEIWIPGVDFQSTWDASAVYQPGDTVIYGGYSYINRLANNTNIIPSVNASGEDREWDLLTTGYNFKEEWIPQTLYHVGDVVRRNGYVFTALVDNNGQDPTGLIVNKNYVSHIGTALTLESVAGLFAGMIVAGQGFTNAQTVIELVDEETVILSGAPTTDPTGSLQFSGINSANWRLLAPGIRWRYFWSDTQIDSLGQPILGIDYVVGDIIVWQNATYQCIRTHNTNTGLRPDLDEDSLYWVLYLPHDAKNAGRLFGDIVVFDGDQNKSVPLAIGEQDLILRKIDSFPAWRNITSIQKVYYVAPNGVDAENYGDTLDRPFRSVRYACQKAAQGEVFINSAFLLDANKDFLAAEVYEWMVFQKENNIAPFDSSSEFDEFSSKRDTRYIIDALAYDISRNGNSQTVAAALAYFSQENNDTYINQAVFDTIEYIVASLKYLQTLLPLIVRNQFPTNNYQTINEVTFNVEEQVIDGTRTFEENTDEVVSSLLTNIVINALENATKAFIPPPNQRLTTTINIKTGTYFEELPIVVPANTALNGDELRGTVIRPANAFYTDTRAINILTNKFIVSSVVGIEEGMPVQFVGEQIFGGIIGSQTYYVKDVDSQGFSVAVTPLSNEVILTTGIGQMMVYGGGSLSDMFYVQNGSGIRNMTVSGLAGGLTEANEFLTRRPTGGSYVSLDPGRGPDDTRAWIYRKSPYIQNVTTFGNGCTGCKIDGTLHNGGNRSIVSNDFTQILSDGVGVWCTGEAALTELVSVFSYYNYCGYLAEAGGRIRATNGNSSYGTFGVIAEGFVENETPITGTVFNRSQQIQASVQSSFGSQAQLIKVEYNNSGAEYYSETTNLLRYSNNFINGQWSNDGNVVVTQNNISPTGQANAWTLNGLTSGTDSAYLFQNNAILPTGKTYLSVSGTNITGSGIGATFNIEVRSTGYVVTVASGGTGYVIGNQIVVPGINLGGVSGVNDCVIQISGLSGSSVTAVTASGTVPAGSKTNYVFSIHCKQITASEIFLYAIFTGSNLKASGISFNFDTGIITQFSSVGGGNTPESAGVVVLEDGWFRIWFVVNDADGLNDNLQYRVYPRGKFGNTGSTLIYGAQLTVGNALTFYLETQNTRYRAHADFNITGAGINAIAVADELRSGAVFQTRIVADSRGNVGGRGYLITTNNGQSGTDKSFTIAGSDTNTLASIVGMRLFIQSGLGAGQYGYISNLEPITKTVNILKESFTPLTVESTSSAGNLFNLSSTDTTATMYVDMPVQFIPTYYTTNVTKSSIETVTITQTIGGTVSSIVIDTTNRLFVNMPITFSGVTFGGVTLNFTYYVKEIINENEFTISTTLSGVLWPLNSETGSMELNYPSGTGYLTAGSTADMIVNMPIVFTGSVFGGIAANTEYYINDIVDSENFTVSSSLVNVVVSNTDSAGVITAADTGNLFSLNPIVFTGSSFGGIAVDTVYYVERVINSSTFTIASALVEAEVIATAAVTNLITVNSTAGFTANSPIVFVGNTIGNLVAEITYYILAVNDATTFTVSSSIGGSTITLGSAVGKFKLKTSAGTLTTTTGTGSMTAQSTSPKFVPIKATGNMTATFRTSIYGNVATGTDYYVRTINPTSFTVASAPGGSNIIVPTDSGSMRVAASGWDHINPGTPILNLLDSSSVYFIEPRLTWSPPPFNQVSGGDTTVLAPGSAWRSLANGNGFFIALADGNATASRSVDGTSWTSLALPVTRAWTDIAYGNNYWVIISSGGGGSASTVLYSSSNGNGWIETELTSNTTWSNLVYGNGMFVAIASGTGTSAYSNNFGGTWLTGTGLPSANWVGLAYGVGRFVSIAGGTTTAAYSNNGTSWTSTTLPASSNWSDVAFGNGRFVAVSSTTARTAYSLDGINWNLSNLTIAADKIAYGQGVFVAVKSGSTTAYTSEDGINWKIQVVSNSTYGAIEFGYVTSSVPGSTAGTGTFITVGGTQTSTMMYAGATPMGRPTIVSSTIPAITMWEAGSNYITPPTLTITDPNISITAVTNQRLAQGSLGNPSFFNRGEGYSTNSTSITVRGDGYADQFQIGFRLICKDITRLPSPGDNLQIEGIDEVFKVTSATSVFGTQAPNLEANIFISPELTVATSPADGTELSIRTKYSQVRLTNHDFLSIGYGDQIETNYPNLPESTVLSPQDQTIETNNGRVFYTSTDQDGNFKVGNLFAVEQATGIVTISATQFDLGGLDQLTIGGIAVGGSSVVVRQFSTDPTFVANSNEIIPTQRAIKAYLTSRLSQGGSNTFTGQLTAGTVIIGGPDRIASTVPQGIVGHAVKIPVLANISGSQAAWAGDGASAYMFIKGFWRR